MPFNRLLYFLIHNDTPCTKSQNDLCSFWATVCKTVRPVLSNRCPVCLFVYLSCPVLSVMLVYCGQTVGWIKMKLGMEVGLGPGDFVLDGDPAPPQKKKEHTPNFRSMSVVAKRLDGSRCHLVSREASIQATLV